MRELKINKTMITFLIISLMNYLLIILDFTAVHTSKNNVVTTVEYNGLMWVGLDIWSRWFNGDYSGEDTIKWVKITRTKIK